MRSNGPLLPGAVDRDHGKTGLWLRWSGSAIGILSFALGTVVVCPERGAAYNWEAGVQPFVASGDYGSGTDTSIFYVPFILRRLFSRGNIDLEIPYESVTSGDSVTVIQGVPNRAGRVRTIEQETSETNSGLGDVVVRGRYFLTEATARTPLVALTSRIKFPTADEDEGLGTGKTDVGFGTELSVDLPRRYVGFGNLGYTLIGDPEGVDLRNQWNVGFGVGYLFSDKTFGSVSYEESTRLQSGTDGPADLMLAVSHLYRPRLRFTASMLLGLSNGSPDVGVSGGAFVKF